MESDTDESVASPAAQPVPDLTPPPLLPNSLQPEKDFILRFETLPELWDPTNPQYTNKYKRNEKLGILLLILKKVKPNATIEDVKKKINIIRSNYRRELKKIKISEESGAGIDEVYCPKIWYFPYLNFLRKLEQTLPAHQNKVAAESKRKNSQKLHQIVHRKTPTLNNSKILPPPPPPPPSLVKESRDEMLVRACRYLTEPCNESSQHLKISNPIALEWADTLERLDPIQRLYAKKAINDILFEAELGNLHRNSVKINELNNHPPQYLQDVHQQ